MGVIPTFSSPPDPEPAQEPPADSPPPASPPSPSLLGRLRNRASGPPTDTPTATSSAGDSSVQKPTARELAFAVAGVIGLVAGAAAYVTRARRGRELRRPTSRELDDIAQPLARIALRRTDATWLNKDLMDVLAAGSAVGVYLNNGPLTRPIVDDPGVPGNLQEAHA